MAGSLGTSQLLRIQVEARIRKDILSGNLDTNGRLPPMRDLAAHFQVSLGTVANALANLRREGLLATQRKKGTFLPSHMNVRRTRRTGNLGVIAEYKDEALEDKMIFDIFDGIRRAGEAKGYQTLYLGAREAGAEDHGLPLPGGLRDIDGLVYVINARPSHKLIRMIHERSIPMVLTDWFDPRFKCDGIVVDNVPASQEAVRNLIVRGHRRIAFLNSDSGPSASQRYHGYRLALEKEGIPFDPRLVSRTIPSAAKGRKAMRRLFEYKPTALFAFNDYLALGAILAVLGSGGTIPHDLSVVGFGNQGKILARALDIELATVKFDHKAMGSLAVKRLLDRIAGKETPFEEIRMNAQWMAGNSIANIGQ